MVLGVGCFLMSEVLLCGEGFRSLEGCLERICKAVVDRDIRHVPYLRPFFIPNQPTYIVHRARAECSSALPSYRGTSLTRKRTFIGPYRRPMPRVLGGSLGGGAISYERDTPVPRKVFTQCSARPRPYRGSSLKRNIHPHRTTIGPWG